MVKRERQTIGGKYSLGFNYRIGSLTGNSNHFGARHYFNAQKLKTNNFCALF